MKKILVLSLAVLAIPMMVFAAERTVVLEIGTGCWCTYCPGAALGAEDLVHEYPGEILVLENHNGDPFESIETNARNQGFYGISGYPTAWFDGLEDVVGGNHSQSMFSTYEPIFLERRAVESPISIELEKTYSAAFKGEGTVTATIINESEETITGKLHFTMTESHIPYTWQGQDSVHFAVRDYMEDHNGQQITIEPGDTLVESRDFVTFVDWNETTNQPNHIELGCFLQALGTGLGTEIYNGALLPLVAPLQAEVSSSEIDNETGELGPWVEADFYVTLLNQGEEGWDTLTGVLYCDDEDVTVDDPDGSWGPAAPGEYVTNTDDPFHLDCGMGCDEGHRPMMTLELTDGYGQTIETEFQVFEPLGVTDADPGDFHLQVPSILTGRAFMSLSLPAAGDVEVTLMDASGRVIKTLHDGQASSDLNLIPITAEGIPDGMYFIKATAGSSTITQKLLILN